MIFLYIIIFIGFMIYSSFSILNIINYELSIRLNKTLSEIENLSSKEIKENFFKYYNNFTEKSKINLILYEIIFIGSLITLLILIF